MYHKVIIPILLLISIALSSCADQKSPLIPEHRIVGYYGNFYSTRMGALGEYPPDEMIERLQQEVQAWEKADPKTPVIPVIHYIAVVAQNNPGQSGLYILRMPDHQIQKAIDLAKKIDGIVTLDVQVGFSSVENEIPRLEQYLKQPNVMLAIDPEFSMKSDDPPGTKIGTHDAEDINFVVNYLTDLVKKNNLPPKILVIHRFTQRMVTNYKDIKDTPEVQIVIDMDGFGDQALKRSSYQAYIVREPVEFTGFKMFYKQDTQTGGELYTPEQLLKFKPVPMYILYQ